MTKPDMIGKTPAGKSRWLDTLILVLIMAAGLLVFCSDVNPEFIGNDEVEIFVDHLQFGYWDVVPNEFSASGLRDWLVFNSHILFRGRHGQSPSIILGPLYRLMDLAGVPFSKFTINLPVAVLSCITCGLCYLLLAGYVGRLFALLTSLLLLSSPVFAMNSRTIACGFLVIQPFNQILCIYAMWNLSAERKSRWFAGLVLLQVVMSDVLFPVTISISILSYLYREKIAGAYRNFREFLWFVRSDENHLKAGVVWMPAVIMLSLILLITIISLASKTLRFESIILSAISHSGGFEPEAPKSFETFYDYLSMLLGELFFIALFLLVAGLIIRTERKPRFLYLNFFSVCGAIAFFAIWYLVVPNYFVPKMFYQIYLLLPLVILVVISGYNISLKIPKIKGTVIIGLLLLVISSSLMTAGLVWNAGTIIFAEFDGRREIGFGRVVENEGTKAAGFVIREVVSSQVKRNKHIKGLNLYANINNYSLATFSGFREMTKKYDLTINSSTNGTNSKMAGLLHEQLNNEALLKVGVCVDCDSTSAIGGMSFTSYKIYDGDRETALVVFYPGLSPDELVIAPGKYQLKELEALYDKKYSRLIDYFYP